MAAELVFVLTYLLLATRARDALRLERPTAALIGAVAMVAVGGLDRTTALAAIDLDVLALVFGLLLIAATLHHAQVFRRIAFEVVTRTRSARSLLWGLTFVAGGLSALLLNDTVCVMLTPLVVAVVVEARLPPLPYLLALATASNLGGVATYSGNPQNMLIGSAASGHLSYAQYAAIGVPVALACLAANVWLLGWMFRRDLPTGPLRERQPPKPALDRALAWKGAGAVGAFAVMASIGVSLPGAALTAAAGLLLVARTDSGRVFALVDWPLLVFFAGLFVVVAGLAQAGTLDAVWAAVGPHLADAGWPSLALFVACVVVGSNVVSNVPLVLVLAAWVPSLPGPAWQWLTLAMGSTLAGNLTMFGSVANIIVFDAAGPRGRIGFWRFLRYGAPVTLLSLVVATVMLALLTVIGWTTWIGLPPPPWR